MTDNFIGLNGLIELYVVFGCDSSGIIQKIVDALNSLFLELSQHAAVLLDFLKFRFWELIRSVKECVINYEAISYPKAPNIARCRPIF